MKIGKKILVALVACAMLTTSVLCIVPAFAGEETVVSETIENVADNATETGDVLEAGIQEGPEFAEDIIQEEEPGDTAAQEDLVPSVDEIQEEQPEETELKTEQPDEATVENEALSLDDIVAVMDGKGFKSVQEAIDAAPIIEEYITVTMVADSIENIGINPDKKIVLDLNGYILQGKDGSNEPVVINEGKLTIKDSKEGDVLHYFVVDENGLWVLAKDAKDGKHYSELTERPSEKTVVAVDSGVITGGKTDKSGAGIVSVGTLDLESGAIVGNSANICGGVYIDNGGTFNINGGSILGNTAKKTFDYPTAGGVFCQDGKIFLAGGTVGFNTASAGGVCIYKGTFDFYDGTISYNLGLDGGGVNVGNTESPEFAVFVMSKYASIIGNTAINSGGGISINKYSRVSLLDGEIRGNKVGDPEVLAPSVNKYIGGGVSVTATENEFILGGEIVITGNTDLNGNPNNLFLQDGKLVTISKEYGLTGNALIGVNIDYDQKGVVTAKTDKDYSEFFTCDYQQFGINDAVSGDDHQIMIVEEVAKNVDTGKLYYSVGEAIKDAKNGQTICMIADSQENIIIAPNMNIILDLNGMVLKGLGAGPVIQNEGTLTIKDSKEGKRVHCFGTLLTGLWVLDPSAKEGVLYSELTERPVVGDITAVDSGVITGGLTDKGGAGIYSSGTLTLEGGSIVGNSSVSGGGGVFVDKGSTFKIKGGSILGNLVQNNTDTFSAGGVCSYEGNVIMTDGEVGFNTFAGKCGAGGVNLYKGTFDFSGGTICNNLGVRGGGVYVGNGDKSVGEAIFTMSGTATIARNEASECGGGISTDEFGQVNLFGGEIRDNKASDPDAKGYSSENHIGGGIDVWSGNNKLTLGGEIVIAGNTDFKGNPNNLYIYGGTTVAVSNKYELQGKASIGVNTYPIPTNKVTDEIDKDYSGFFTSDNKKYGINDEKNGDKHFVAIVEAAAKNMNTSALYPSLKEAVEKAGKGETIRMLRDTVEDLNIAAGQAVTLDLNGRVLSGTGKTCVINNMGQLTIIDSTIKEGKSIKERYFTDDECAHGVLAGEKCDKCPDGTATKDGCYETYSETQLSLDSYDYITVTGGVITGGKGLESEGKTFGGAIYSEKGSKLIIECGSICGNSASTGGAIWVNSDAKIIFNHGLIAGNLAENGGGIYLDNREGKTSTLEMNSGAAISYNTATVIAGGVYVEDGDQMMMRGGEISYNRAGDVAGGVYIRKHKENTFFGVSGNVRISRNMAGKPDDLHDSNVCLEENTLIEVDPDKGLEKETEIGVTILFEKHTGKFTSTVKSDFANNFYSDSLAYKVNYVKEAEVLELIRYDLSNITYRTSNIYPEVTDMVSEQAVAIAKDAFGTPAKGTVVIYAQAANFEKTGKYLGIYSDKETGGRWESTSAMTLEEIIKDLNTTKQYDYYVIGDFREYPVVSDFDITLPKESDYDGNTRTATVKAKSGVSGMGQITVKYYKDGTLLSSAPKDAGTYQVKIDVSKGDHFESVSDLTDTSWTFTISKVQLSVSGTTVSNKTYDGTNQAEVTLGTVEGIVGKEDVKVTAAGTFEDKNAGTAKEVTVVYDIEGKDIGNYIAPKDGETSADILKKAVTMTSSDAEKTYDGQPLNNNEVKDTGFIQGEGAEYTVTGGQVSVGVSKNTFTYKFKAGTNGDNYDITVVFGTLSVKSQGGEEPAVENDALKKILDKNSEKPEYKDKNLAVECRISKNIPATDEKLIKDNIGSKKADMISVDLILVVDGVDKNIGSENDELISITYKFDFKNKTDLQVLRIHGGKLDIITEKANAKGEYYKQDKDAGTITVVAKGYSTFAFAYNEAATPVPVPGTADNNHLTLWLVLMAMAMGTLVAAGFVRVKKARR